MYPSNHGNYDDDDDEDLPQLINNPSNTNARAGGSSSSAAAAAVGRGRGTSSGTNGSIGGYGAYAGYGAPSTIGGYAGGMAGAMAGPGGMMMGPGGGRGRGFGGGGGGILGGLMGFGGAGGGAYGYGMGGGYGGDYGAEIMAPPGAYDEYYKAYSVAVMDAAEREGLSYGGKICMPPSTLARLTNINCPNPYTFQLFNPKDPKNLHTHAGVLEFIAQESCCYLPRWMMKQLKLNEGDPIRLKNVELPKGTFVKLQAQSIDFLQVSDAKAVLEAAFRNYQSVSKGDIIEIVYNSLTFEFLVVETKPDAPGIMLIDTDLETDFAEPVGYVEPERPKPVPVATMADKLKIDLNSTVPATRPASVMSGRAGSSIAGSLDAGSELEAFKGVGNTLEGRKSKGKGKAKKIGKVDPDSKILRTDKPRMMTNELLTDGKLVPAALNLPKGKLFFGFTYKPFNPELQAVKPKPEDGAGAKPNPSFLGSGAALNGRNRLPGDSTNSKPEASSSSSTPSKSPAIKVEPTADPWANLTGGNRLESKGTRGTTSASTSQIAGSTATAVTATAAAGAGAAIVIEDDSDDDGGGSLVAAGGEEEGEDEEDDDGMNDGGGQGDDDPVDLDEYDENDVYWDEDDAIVIDSD